MNDEIRDPEPGDTLIKESGDKTLYADWMAGNWYFYPDGYKEAADRLVDQIQENWAPDDRLICPIIFLYRHFVELKLKAIVIELDRLSGTEMPDGQFTKHELRQLWSYVKSHLNCIRDGELDKQISNILDKLIKDLADLDPDSMHFRYPHNKKFEEMKLPYSLSMGNFKDVMEGLKNGLALIEAGIDLEKEARALDAELQAEVNSYMSDFC